MNELNDRIGRWLSKKEKRQYQLIQIESSLACSLECVMCPWRELRSGGETMSMETFRRIIPYLSQAYNVDFTGGGEPLTNANLVDMVREAKNAGCQTGFSTNGKRLTPEMSQQLISAGLDWISFSVDAASSEMYERIRQGANFETIIGNIAALRDLKLAHSLKKPEMMMVFVAMGGEPDIKNFLELPQYVDLAKELGVEQIIVKNLDVILNDEDDNRRLFRHDNSPVEDVDEVILQAQARAQEVGVKLRRYLLQPQEQAVCEHNPIASVFINWEGWVSPCITHAYAEERVFQGKRVKPVCQRFGNIRQSSLNDIWELPAYCEFREQFQRRQNAARQQVFNALLENDAGAELPPPPKGCDSCYYLYGI